jgi:glutathione peroxidase
MPTIYDFTAKSIDGRDVPLSDYRGKVLLIVNTASKCGFTPQYEGLEKLHEDYAARDFEVLGFPCNQFGAQEPGDEAEIANFCKLTYDVSFPMFAKIDVNGDAAHPLYRYLKGEGPARQRGHQVELHQVPRRPRRQGRRSLRPHHQARGIEGGNREAALRPFRSWGDMVALARRVP